MRRTLIPSLMAAAAVVLAGGLGAVVEKSWAQGAQAQAGATLKIAARRITESQYRHAVRDIFGPQVTINARFEPEVREGGLLAIGTNQLSITSSGFEQYFSLAKSISDQVLAPARRAATVPCQPADPKKADDACARQFLVKYGESLFRRPLTEPEITARLRTAAMTAGQAGDFYEGLKFALTSLLVAPEFLFRMEVAETDPANPAQYRLDGYTKASRLSFLFWDSPPDAELMAAAKSGAIHTPEGLNAQLTRLSASPRLQDGARAFFTDMLQLDQFESLNKDPTAYPKFSQAVADSAREETLRSVVNLLITRRGDYRDLFTTNETFINRPLAAVYQVPFAGTAEWAPYTFPASAERSGILTQTTFLSLFSHPAASSPTKRGVKLHEIFMCEPTPEPPANVDFSKVQALTVGTVRTRLLDHMTNEGCAACHRISDPAGLALEHFDGLGQLRTLENGKPIDVSASIDGTRIVGAQGLGRMLRGNPKVPACLVRNIFAYGVGRATDERDEDYIADQARAFATVGYRMPDLMVRIASTPEFFKVKVPAGAAPSTAPRVAAAQPRTSAGDAR